MAFQVLWLGRRTIFCFNSLDFVKREIDCLAQCKRATLDVMCVSYGELLCVLEEFGKIQRRYPTILYRTEESEQMSKKDIKRPDFVKVYCLSLARYVWYL